LIKYHFKIRTWFLLAGLLLAGIGAFAQKHTIDSSAVKKSTAPPKEEDLMDIGIKLFRLKTPPKPDSECIKPGKILLAVFPAVGYALQSGGVAIVATNISFYTAAVNTNLSTISFNPEYSFMQQTIIPVITSIWTKDNKFNFLGDWRFYKYPSYTYGLGSRTVLDKVDSINYSYFKFYQEALMRMAPHLYGGIGYNLDYHWQIQDYGESTDFNQYNGNATKTVSSGLIAHVKYDDRENINNPINAFYGSVIYRYNSTILGSDNDWQYLQVEMRKYFKLNPRGTTILALWNWNEFTFGGKAPYLDLPSTGWDTYSNTGRGYIQGRFRGNEMVYVESELRFNILKNGLLGGVVFCNAETVSKTFNTLGAGVISPGEGFGIRIKLNRYSNTNLCLDYGFGTQNSRGFFFNIGEVF